VILSLKTYLHYYIIMNQFESRFKNMTKNNLTQEKNNLPKDSLNKHISLFQDDLLQNINLQYQKNWKKLSKDSKKKILSNYCIQENISNSEYLKKYITKLDVEYDQQKMIILNIKNTLKIENQDSSSFDLQITDLKLPKSKKTILNKVEAELSADI